MLAPVVRAELANRLVSAGLRRLEVVSFVNSRLVPKMAQAEAVVASLTERHGVTYAGLVLNERGYERLAATGLTRVHFVIAATDSFSIRNANATVAGALTRAERVIARGHGDGRTVAVAIAVSFGCPFEGEVDSGRVLELARRVFEAGADEIVLADTIGVAVPGQVHRLVSEVRKLGRPVGIHLHNTRNTGLGNVYASLEAEVDVVDSAIGGTGGCPFAPNATGNVATEDVVYMLHREGFDTGIDLGALLEITRWLEGLLGHPLPSGVYRAGVFPPPANTAVA